MEQKQDTSKPITEKDFIKNVLTKRTDELNRISYTFSLNRIAESIPCDLDFETKIMRHPVIENIENIGRISFGHFYFDHLSYDQSDNREKYFISNFSYYIADNSLFYTIDFNRYSRFVCDSEILYVCQAYPKNKYFKNELIKVCIAIATVKSFYILPFHGNNMYVEYGFKDKIPFICTSLTPLNNGDFFAGSFDGYAYHITYEVSPQNDVSNININNSNLLNNGKCNFTVVIYPGIHNKILPSITSKLPFAFTGKIVSLDYHKRSNVLLTLNDDHIITWYVLDKNYTVLSHDSFECPGCTHLKYVGYEGDNKIPVFLAYIKKDDYQNADDIMRDLSDDNTTVFRGYFLIQYKHYSLNMDCAYYTIFSFFLHVCSKDSGKCLCIKNARSKAWNNKMSRVELALSDDEYILSFVEPFQILIDGNSPFFYNEFYHNLFFGRTEFGILTTKRFIMFRYKIKIQSADEIKRLIYATYLAEPVVERVYNTKTCEDIISFTHFFSLKYIDTILKYLNSLPPCESLKEYLTSIKSILDNDTSVFDDQKLFSIFSSDDYTLYDKKLSYLKTITDQSKVKSNQKHSNLENIIQLVKKRDFKDAISKFIAFTTESIKDQECQAICIYMINKNDQQVYNLLKEYYIKFYRDFFALFHDNVEELVIYRDNLHKKEPFVKLFYLYVFYYMKATGREEELSKYSNKYLHNYYISQKKQCDDLKLYIKEGMYKKVSDDLIKLLSNKLPDNIKLQDVYSVLKELMISMKRSEIDPTLILAYKTMKIAESLHIAMNPKINLQYLFDYCSKIKDWKTMIYILDLTNVNTANFETLLAEIWANFLLTCVSMEKSELEISSTIKTISYEIENTNKLFDFSVIVRVFEEFRVNHSFDVFWTTKTILGCRGQGNNAYLLIEELYSLLYKASIKSASTCDILYNIFFIIKDNNIKNYNKLKELIDMYKLNSHGYPHAEEVNNLLMHIDRSKTL